MNKTECIDPCFRLFADIEQLGGELGAMMYAGLAQEYQEYKKGWNIDIEYPQQIISKHMIHETTVVTAYKIF